MLLDLPLEIRLRIYDLLFINQLVTVSVDFDQYRRDVSGLQPGMQVVPMSAQVIRVCKQIYQEGQTRLYSSNIFDCSQGTGIKPLLHSVGPKNFSLIRHLKLDWDELQSVSWSLAKEDYKAATKGLRCLEMAHWRTRILGGSSFLWRQAKSYERQLCESAINICDKHPTLKVVAQKAYHRTSRVEARPTHIRIKWRFVAGLDDLSIDEVAVPLHRELEELAEDQGEDRAPSMMIDPF